MNYKLGKVLYSANVDDDGKVDLEEWIVRTIRGGKITAVWKNNVSWGKRSPKHGDFGWLPNIPHWMRQSWAVGGEPMLLYPTKKQAYAHILRGLTHYVDEGTDAYDRAKRQLTKLSK